MRIDTYVVGKHFHPNHHPIIIYPKKKPRKSDFSFDCSGIKDQLRHNCEDVLKAECPGETLFFVKTSLLAVY